MAARAWALHGSQSRPAQGVHVPPPGLRELASAGCRRSSGFEADRAGHGSSRAEVAKALLAALESAGPDVAARVALIDAFGALGQTAGADPAVAAWFKSGRTPATLAETGARLRALASLVPADQKDSVARAYETMPLDALADLQDAAGKALVKIDPKSAGSLIGTRLAAKHAAGLSTEQELNLAGHSAPRHGNTSSS